MEQSVGISIIEVLKQISAVLPILVGSICTLDELLISIFKIENRTVKQVLAWVISAVICIGMVLTSQLSFGTNSIWLDMLLSLIPALLAGMVANSLSDLTAIQKLLELLMTILGLKKKV